MIYLAAESGADAAKFQNFRASMIVSDAGFRSLGSQRSHQATWKKSVFEVYQAASLPFEWTPVLRDTCREAGIHYFSSPYDFEAVDMLDAHVPAHKIGSGDITWLEISVVVGGDVGDEVGRVIGPHPTIGDLDGVHARMASCQGPAACGSGMWVTENAFKR